MESTSSTSSLPWSTILRVRSSHFDTQTSSHLSSEMRLSALQAISDDKTLLTIPPFFSRKPTGKDESLVSLRRESRTRFLKRKTEEMLSGSELDLIWNLLEKFSGDPTPEEGKRIDWDGVSNVVEEFGQRCRPFFNAGTFLKFPMDSRGRIAIYDLFQFVMRQVSLRQIRIGFCYYDSAGYGYLREEDLENYIFELIPTLPQLSSLGSEFYPFYVCTAVRKFFFFLDPGHKGKIGIRQLITSPILAELFELRGETVSDENWFGAASALRVYGQYLNLDKDRNGMLSRQEMSRYGNGTLTDVFLDRLFETQHTYGGEIDFKSFLDFTLAMEHKKSDQGLAYFWRILDVQHRGFMTIFDLNVFFREVLEKLVAAGNDPVDAADVRDELFDMIHPKEHHKITLQDVLKSGWGETFVSILTDVKGFWLYDHRESF